jgi:hypothetical protein
METCGTCKHWKLIDAEEELIDDPRFGTCAAIPQGQSEWDEASDRNMVVGDWKAVAVDGSGYFAAIKTRECFGCVLHEPLPATAEIAEK